jgi:dolichol-phosphate mannosyltransferase
MKETYLTVIPAYNEEATIQQVVEGAIQYTDVCVINDASKDKTPEILARLQEVYPEKLHVIHHAKNTHIPGGIQDGMKYAATKAYTYLITMDAGMSHDPAVLPSFMSHSPCDLLIGSREITDGVPIYRKLISFLAARVMNYCMSSSVFNLFGPGISDCTSGFRRYSARAYTYIAGKELESVAFDFHMEALYLTYMMGGTIDELDIYYKFSNSSFNKRVLKQAIHFAFQLLKKKF